MDKKEQLIFNHLKEKIEKRVFDEYDIYAFYILVRGVIGKSKYPFISDFGDFIAHRKRNRGFIMDAIKGAIDSHYSCKNDSSKEIQGYQGIPYDKWKKEWGTFADDFNISLSEQIIEEITICTFSLLQGSVYECSCYKGHVEVIGDIEKKLSIATVEDDNKDAPYICFMTTPSIVNNNCSSIVLDEPFETFRQDGELHIKNIRGIIF